MFRFLKEVKYSMKMRRHIFFILLILMGLVSSVYLFRESLESTLKKAFPSDYGVAEAEKPSKYRIDGKYEQTATAKDVDIQAELMLNSALRNADWMTYEEAFLYDNLYVKNYSGTDKALVGYGTEKVTGSKDVEIERGKYSRLQSAWLSEEVLKAEGFGGAADRMFAVDNSYLDTMYVVLGAGIESDKYTTGSKLTLRVENLQMNAVVIGFLKPGATMKVGDTVVCLDYYVICPLLDLSGLYDEDREAKKLPTNTDPIYLPEGWFKEGVNIRDTEAENETVENSGKKYSAAKCLWIAEDDIKAMEEVPGWLNTLMEAKSTEDGTYSIYAGASYAKNKLISSGANATVMTLYNGAKKIVCYGFCPEGEKITLGGKEYALDDMIVIILHNKTNTKTTTTTTQTTEGNTTGNGETTNTTDTAKNESEGKTFETSERMRLFRILVLKNSCFVNTKLSPDEAERKLEQILESSWENYQKDNPNLKRTSTYRIHEADPEGSVVYRDNIREIPGKLKKFDKPGYYICILLLALFFIYKFFRGMDYYTTIYMTGDTKVEIILLFVFEAAVLYAAACGVGILFAWVVSKMLSLGSVSTAPVFAKNLRIVLFPLIALATVVIVKDFGKLFRRR
ncbi:MAG: ABC transporter permease [Lachnospiraceae bacterium]|nr:ABC transporter permease [Lachnospiraceae bacterium]